MTCKHGSTSVVCSYCDAETIEQNENMNELMENPETNGQAADFKREMMQDKDTHETVLVENDNPGNLLQGDKTIVTSGANVIELTEQPKPKFTLIDLEQYLSKIFTATMTSNKIIVESKIAMSAVDKDLLVICIREANSNLQELIAKVDKIKSDLDIIEMPQSITSAVMTELDTEKVAFHVCGVQLWENGVMKGTSLYSSVFKARKIRDILNAKFAELKVKHEAKIVNYPVY